MYLTTGMATPRIRLGCCSVKRDAVGSPLPFGRNGNVGSLVPLVPHPAKSANPPIANMMLFSRHPPRSYETTRQNTTPAAQWNVSVRSGNGSILKLV